jgi:hypothetical protein
MRLASIVLPEPGGPISKMLCPPEEAISRARLAFCFPADFLEVHQEVLGLAQELVSVHLEASDTVAGIDEMNNVQQRFDWVYFEPIHYRGFTRVDLRDDHPSYLPIASLDSDGQCAANST